MIKNIVFFVEMSPKRFVTWEVTNYFAFGESKIAFTK